MSGPTGGKRHWEDVYEGKEPESVSWYQPHATRSLALIQRIAPSVDTPIIDVGGGASVLVDDLLNAGYHDLTVLDLAASALAAANARLGALSDQVTWIEGDVRSTPLPEATYGVWHDRAGFHFLVDPTDRAAYIRQVQRAVRPGGFVVVATFAEDGPAKCSGLPVVRYSPDTLHREFGDGFDFVASEREVHATPMGTQQSFLYSLLRWTGEPAR